MALIYIDLDDTLVDFLQGVCDAHNKQNPQEKSIEKHQLNDWHQNGVFIEPYIHTEGFFTNLKIKEYGVEVLKVLSEKHDIKILTAFPTPQSAKEKVEFVEKHLPFIGYKNMTLSWDKGLLKGDLLFDDSPLFLPKFEGLKVAFDTTYNQNVEVDARVDSWLDFMDRVIEWEVQGKLSKKG